MKSFNFLILFFLIVWKNINIFYKKTSLNIKILVLKIIKIKLYVLTWCLNNILRFINEFFLLFIPLIFLNIIWECKIWRKSLSDFCLELIYLQTDVRIYNMDYQFIATISICHCCYFLLYFHYYFLLILQTVNNLKLAGRLHYLSTFFKLIN